jgi:hypothetical protein
LISIETARVVVGHSRMRALQPISEAAHHRFGHDLVGQIRTLDLA